MKDNKTKNKIIGISIGILIVLLVVISSTYAYWQITKSQQDPNSIIAACLDFNVDFPVGISKDNAWPISDSEGMNLDGYTFTVTNNCDTDVNYVIGLESVTSDGITNYLLDSSVGIGFDGVNKGTYADLTDLEGPSTDARGSKELQTAVVKGNEQNTHNLKLWIDDKSDVSEQGRGFAAKLFITGGQEIENDNPNILTAESCFEITEEGEIIGYDEACGESVVIPATVNGVAVKTIDSNAFKYKGLTTMYYDENENQVDSIDMTNVNLAIVGGEDGLLYAITYTEDEQILTEIKGFLINNGISEENIYASTDENVPALKIGETKTYGNFISEENSTFVGIEEIEEGDILSINSLDLSQARYLELIEAGAFGLAKLEDVRITDSCSDIGVADIGVADVPTGLTDLKFGEQKELKVGFAAFAGLKVHELTVYTNLKGYGKCTSSGLTGVIPFYKSAIDILNVAPIDDNDTFSPNSFIASFLGTHVDTLNIKTGIKKLGILSFSGIQPNTINLPEGLEIIGEQAFDYTKTKNINIPNSVTEIGSRAFYKLPNTSTITFARSEEDVKANVTLESEWNGSAKVIYAH